MYVITIVAVFLLGNVVSYAASPMLKKITAYLDSSIKMTINGKQFVANDANGNPMIPITYNGSTYLPTRAISQAVGLNVLWDAETRTVKLGKFIVDENGKQKIVIKSPDNKYQLTFNDGWYKDNSLNSLNSSVDLGVMSSNRYTIVIKEDTEDYTSDLNNYFNLIISNMEGKSDNASVDGIIELEVNGNAAMQGKLYAQNSGFNITYLITIIQTEGKFYQVISYATQNKFDDSYGEFLEIAQSFKELL